MSIFIEIVSWLTTIAYLHVSTCSVVYRLSNILACCIKVQPSVSVGNGWPHNALRYH